MFGNSPDQIINSEKAVGTIISKFSSDFILDVIQDNIKIKFRPFNVGPANYPIILEQDFKMALLENPAYRSDIDEARKRTYKQIIDIIASSYNLIVSDEVNEFIPDQMYSLAVTLFDVFVSNFTPRMINFFVQYIIQNKEDINNSIVGAEEIKKNKETIAYGKRMYTDSKLVVIHSVLNDVLTNIASHDIPFPILLNYLVQDKYTAEWLLSLLQDTNDMYKYYYAIYINNPITRPDLFTAIKFDMQRMGSDRSIGVSEFVSEKKG